MAEISDIVDIGTIKLVKGEPYYYTAWGIRYRLSPTGKQMVAQIAFARKSDAEDWARQYYYKPDIVHEVGVVPVKRCVLLETGGNVKTWTEELVE